MQSYLWHSDHGWVQLHTAGERIERIDLIDAAAAKPENGAPWAAAPPLLQRVITWLRQGEDLRRHAEIWQSLNLDQATPFRLQVWRTAFDYLGPGMTMTYGQLARTMGRDITLARAVGQALRHNPFPLIIPCHRIIARQGLGGFMGAVAQDDGRKAAILAREGCSLGPV